MEYPNKYVIDSERKFRVNGTVTDEDIQECLEDIVEEVNDKFTLTMPTSISRDDGGVPAVFSGGEENAVTVFVVLDDVVVDSNVAVEIVADVESQTEGAVVNITAESQSSVPWGANEDEVYADVGEYMFAVTDVFDTVVTTSYGTVENEFDVAETIQPI